MITATVVVVVVVQEAVLLDGERLCRFLCSGRDVVVNQFDSPQRLHTQWAPAIATVPTVLQHGETQTVLMVM